MILILEIHRLIGQNPFRYKAYYPKITVHDYVNRPLPVYIFFHAGGFQECPNYEPPLINNLCIELSRKGWICFTVEYRRGRIKDTDTTKLSVQEQFARYRAIQDGCGAIRSIIKKNRPGDAERFPFIIDETPGFCWRYKCRWYHCTWMRILSNVSRLSN